MVIINTRIRFFSSIFQESMHVLEHGIIIIQAILDGIQVKISTIEENISKHNVANSFFIFVKY